MSWKDNIKFKTRNGSWIGFPNNEKIREASICFNATSHTDNSFYEDYLCFEDIIDERLVDRLEEFIFNKRKMAQEFRYLETDILNKYNSYFNKFTDEERAAMIKVVKTCKDIVEECLDVKL